MALSDRSKNYFQRLAKWPFHVNNERDPSSDMYIQQAVGQKWPSSCQVKTGLLAEMGGYNAILNKKQNFEAASSHVKRPLPSKVLQLSDVNFAPKYVDAELSSPSDHLIDDQCLNIIMAYSSSETPARGSYRRDDGGHCTVLYRQILKTQECWAVPYLVRRSRICTAWWALIAIQKVTACGLRPATTRGFLQNDGRQQTHRPHLLVYLLIAWIDG